MTLLLSLIFLLSSVSEALTRLNSGDTLGALMLLKSDFEKGDEEALKLLSEITGYSRETILALNRSGNLEKRFKKTKRADVFVIRSGPLFRVSDEFFKGFKMALKGYMEIRVFNTDGEEGKALQKLEKVLAQETDLIVGPLTSGELSRLVQKIKYGGVPLLSPTAYFLDRVDRESLLFSFKAKYVIEMREILRRMAELGYTNFALFYPRTPLGYALLSPLQEISEELGLKVIFKVSFSPDSTEFGSQLLALRGSKPDFVFIPFGEPGSRILAFKIRADSLLMPICGLDEWSREDMLKWLLVGLDNFWFAKLKVDSIKILEREREIRAFRRKYQAFYGSKPTEFAMEGYDAGKIVTELFKGSPITPYEAREKLESMGIFYGVSDIILLSKSGEFIKILYIKDGKLKEAS